MSVSLHVTDLALESLGELADSIAPDHWAELEFAVDAELQKFAANPLLASGPILKRPIFRFSFTVSGVSHHWAAVYRWTEDEETIVITQFFRSRT